MPVKSPKHVVRPFLDWCAQYARCLWMWATETAKPFLFSSHGAAGNTWSTILSAWWLLIAFTAVVSRDSCPWLRVPRSSVVCPSKRFSWLNPLKRNKEMVFDSLIYLHLSFGKLLRGGRGRVAGGGRVEGRVEMRLLWRWWKLWRK